MHSFWAGKTSKFSLPGIHAALMTFCSP